jgi:hypothetical protein
MKRILTAFAVMQCALFCQSALAQSAIKTNQTIFSKQANAIDVNATDLEKAFSKQVGETINFTFGNLVINGVVTNVNKPYGNLEKITISCSNYKNAIFAIAKITLPNNTVEYTGRIIHTEFADGYSISHLQGKYTLNKFDTGKLLLECSH